MYAALLPREAERDQLVGLGRREPLPRRERPDALVLDAERPDQASRIAAAARSEICCEVIAVTSASTGSGTCAGRRPWSSADEPGQDRVLGRGERREIEPGAEEAAHLVGRRHVDLDAAVGRADRDLAAVEDAHEPPVDPAVREVVAERAEALGREREVERLGQRDEHARRLCVFRHTSARRSAQTRMSCAFSGSRLYAVGGRDREPDVTRARSYERGSSGADSSQPSVRSTSSARVRWFRTHIRIA